MYNQGKGTGPFSWQSYYSSETHNQKLPPTSIAQPSTPYSASLRVPTFLPPLVNPYAPSQFSNLPTNAQGYTLSSSYVPTSVSEYQSQPRAIPGRGFASSFGGGGNMPCKRQGCSYMGQSNKEVELHMMDRHFIYPPGWNERKRKRDDGGGPDGDASTSILIQQYRIQLDTPEAIQKWIADRKKKWPSSKRVEEKARSTEEARARGELFFTAERTHRDHTQGRGRSRGRGRGASSGRGRGRGRGRDRGMQPPVVHPDDGEDREAQRPHSLRGRAVDRGWGTRGRGILPAGPANSSLSSSESSTSSDESDSNRSPSEDGDSVSDSGSDMDPVKDAVSSRPPPDSNAEANLSSSHSFIQRSMVDDESDEDVMAVDQALGLPSPDSEAEVEAVADLNVGSRDILDSTAPAFTSADASPPSIAEPSVSKAVRKPNRPRHRVPAPPRARPNPFSLTRPTRPSLLRNLLAQDVQVTISNLSQAVRFLVANDCLEGVELKPGEAEETEASKKIIVVTNENGVESAGSSTPATDK